MDDVTPGPDLRRRRVLAGGAAAAGAAWVAPSVLGVQSAAASSHLPPPIVSDPECTLTTNPEKSTATFDGGKLIGGNKLWIFAIAKLPKLADGVPGQMTFTDQRLSLLDKDGAEVVSIPLPDSIITYDGASSTASATHTGGVWDIVAPHCEDKAPGDDIFIGGDLHTIPAGGYPTVEDAMWHGVVALDAGMGGEIQWKWSAAQYEWAPADVNDVQANPWHNSKCNPYSSGDHAGTPQNQDMRDSLIEGPRGGGGSNFTGSWSGSDTLQCP